VDGSAAEPVLNKENTPLTAILTSAMPYNNTAFSNLPSRDIQGRNIVYSIKEESINGKDPLEARYVPEYGISSSGVYIVRNKPAATLTVSKQWVDLSGNPVTDPNLLAAQSSVTFDVYRATTPLEDTTPDDGITNADMLTGIDFIELNETPGMGMRAAEPAFKDQFSGRMVSGFTLNKSGGSNAPDQIDAISGATVTSSAVTNAVNAGLDFYYNVIKGGM
jgi:hypothetical protein